MKIKIHGKVVLTNCLKSYVRGSPKICINISVYIYMYININKHLPSGWSAHQTGATMLSPKPSQRRSRQERNGLHVALYLLWYPIDSLVTAASHGTGLSNLGFTAAPDIKHEIYHKHQTSKMKADSSWKP